jgi:hypothetical protein
VPLPLRNASRIAPRLPLEAARERTKSRIAILTLRSVFLQSHGKKNQDIADIASNALPIGTVYLHMVRFYLNGYVAISSSTLPYGFYACQISIIYLYPERYIPSTLCRYDAACLPKTNKTIKLSMFYVGFGALVITIPALVRLTNKTHLLVLTCHQLIRKIPVWVRHRKVPIN